LLEYLEKLVGKARLATIDTAEKMIREAEEDDDTKGKLCLLMDFV